MFRVYFRLAKKSTKQLVSSYSVKNPVLLGFDHETQLAEKTLFLTVQHTVFFLTHQSKIAKNQFT